MARPCRPVLTQALALLAALAPCVPVAAVEDALSLVQRSSAAQAPFPSTVFELGEAAQVKFEGAQRWVDCTIRSRDGSPDVYDIHVPRVTNSSEGSLLDRDFYGVPAVMLRRVYRGVEVNIEQHENESSWVSAIITGRGTGDTYNVELVENMPGYAIDSVPSSLLREGEESRLKAEHLQQMINENEAMKPELFYMARVKHNPKKLQAALVKAREDAEQRSMGSAQEMAWKEMAKRAEQENVQRKFIEAWKEKRRNETRAKKHAQERAFTEKMKQVQDRVAKDDPVASLIVKVNTFGQVAGKKNMEFLEKAQKVVEQERKAREEERLRQEAAARKVQEQMDQLKAQHQAQLQAAATLRQERPPEIQARMREFELVEQGREKQRQANMEEMERLGEEAAEEYEAVEEARVASVAGRRKSAARKGLERAMEIMDTDKLASKPLRSAVKEAEDAGVDAAELDAAKVALVNSLSKKARDTVSHAKATRKLADLQSALKDGSAKVLEIDRLWASITDESLKRGILRFDASELDIAKNLLPEVGKKEVVLLAARARLELARHGRNLETLKEAIEAAEAAGLPEDELDRARNALEDREVKPGAMKNLREAAETWDAAKLAQAVQEAEAAGVPNWRLKGFKRKLADLLSRMPQPSPMLQMLQ